MRNLEEQASRDRALPIAVRLIFEKGGFCRVSLLPGRARGLPEQLEITGSGNPPELIALQEEWYQDIILPDVGALLRSGTEWSGTLADGRRTRWSLSGREIYVLSRHNDLSGFVGTPRLILGEQHVVLCTAEILPEVRRAIELTGSPEPVTLEGANGMPAGWIGLRGVIPRVPVAASPRHEILNALRPLADVDIVLEGGIRLERLTWLTGYPPCIRLQGKSESIDSVMIDGQTAVLGPEGGYVVPRWDVPGQHTVWCTSASGSYSIRDGAEDWEAWDAYTWSLGDSSANCESNSAAICGALILPPGVARESSHATPVPASNPVLLGVVPGQIYTCRARSDIRTKSCMGFPWFDPVWAIPTNALRCDKRIARVLLVADSRFELNPLVSKGERGRSPRAGGEPVKRIKAWCVAILDASRKGLGIEPPEAAALWQLYKKHARAILRARP